MASKMAQERPKRGPRGPQDGPKSAQERPKRAPRGDVSGPDGRALLSSPPSLIDGLQDGPRRASEATKRAPRAPQEGPKTAPRGPKRLPKCPQEGPTMAPRGLQDAPRANDRKSHDIDSCRRRLRALLLSRRSLRPPVLKQRTQTDNSR